MCFYLGLCLSFFRYEAFVSMQSNSLIVAWKAPKFKFQHQPILGSYWDSNAFYSKVYFSQSQNSLFAYRILSLKIIQFIGAGNVADDDDYKWYTNSTCLCKQLNYLSIDRWHQHIKWEEESKWWIRFKRWDFKGIIVKKT